jgi:hypothetical protein
VEALEEARHLVRGIPSRCPDLRARHRPVRRAQADGDLALERELERVGQEVEDDLLPHVAVDEDRLGAGAVDDQAQPRASSAARNTLASSAVKRARSVG